MSSRCTVHMSISQAESMIKISSRTYGSASTLSSGLTKPLGTQPCSSVKLFDLSVFAFRLLTYSQNSVSPVTSRISPFFRFRSHIVREGQLQIEVQTLSRLTVACWSLVENHGQLHLGLHSQFPMFTSHICSRYVHSCRMMAEWHNLFTTHSLQTDWFSSCCQELKEVFAEKRDQNSPDVIGLSSFS